MPTNLYTMHVSLISIAFQYDLAIDVFHELGKTIKRVHDETARFAETFSQYDSDSMWEDANSTIEDLHGAAFVISQTSITTIVSRVKALHEFAECDGHSISSIPNQKGEMLASNSPLIPSKPVTYIQAIDAFANYFKHHDEWPRGWVNVDARGKPTIETLESLGVHYGTSAILKNAMQFFDSSLLDLANTINFWHEGILGKLKNELKDSELI